MQRPTPTYLLSNPDLVTPVAPWCAALDNLELGILLLSQPWLAGGGVRRADLERQLSQLARDLPIGQVYFQRVNRSVARLVDIEVLRVEGTGRSRRFVGTPRGFAAVILNLTVVRSDPTIDGREFELKRALVAMWNLVFERMSELPDETSLGSEAESFFDEVERLEVWGRPVITDEVVDGALNVLGLIESQRRQVEARLEETERRLEQLRAPDELLAGVDLARLAEQVAPGASLADDPKAAAMVRATAATALPGLNLRAAELRYRRYLEYLDELVAMYSRELRVVDLGTMRRLAGRTGS